MQFSYTTNGAGDGSLNSYGNNEISVLGDKLRVQIGDSDGYRAISGIGIYELELQGDNLQTAQRLSTLLCSPIDTKSDVPSIDRYMAICDRENRNSVLSDFGRPIAIEISNFIDSLIDAGIQYGRKVVKLDISLVSID